MSIFGLVFIDQFKTVLCVNQYCMLTILFQNTEYHRKCLNINIPYIDASLNIFDRFKREQIYIDLLKLIYFSDTQYILSKIRNLGRLTHLAKGYGNGYCNVDKMRVNRGRSEELYTQRVCAWNINIIIVISYSSALHT